MEETYALELRDISKRFGSVQANDHVNLTLRKSEILAILGENGSGKTTLMNMIYGIIIQMRSYFCKWEGSKNPFAKRLL